MSRNRRFLIWAIALALALIMVSGCSNSDDQNNITPVSDQTIKISGQVTDALGEPVSKIAVYLHESKSSADKGKKIDTSDKTGSFSLILPRDGDYSVSVASQGAAAEASFSVKNNAMQSSTGRPLKTLEINLPFYSQKPDALPLNDEGDVKTDKDGLLIIDNILEIVWRKNVSAAEQKRVIANVGGLKIRGDIAELNITEVEVIRGDIDKKATELERSPLIKVAVKDYVIETQYVPSDSDYKNKWKSWWLRKLEAEQVWEIIKRKKPPVGGVVVTDSGFQETHPDLKKIFHTRLRRNYTADPFTDNAAHGNHVSGIISMQANNLGSVGISPRTRIIPMKVKSFRDIAQAIVLASKIRKLSAISISYGFKWRRVDKWRHDNGLSPVTQAQRQAKSDDTDAFLMPAVTLAYNEGIAVVHSAGNDGLPASSNSMNHSSKVITVGATKLTDSLAGFSNYGSLVTIGAPGQNIWSTVDNNRWKYFSGTSMSTPMVSGTIALMRSLNPALSLTEVRNLLVASADKTGSGSRIRLNSWKAALAALGDSYGIKGKVVDDRGKPVKNATVSVDDEGDLDVKTKKDGSFTLAIVPQNRLIIKVRQGQKEGQRTLRALPPRTYTHENVKISVRKKSSSTDDRTLGGKTFTLTVKPNPEIVDRYGNSASGSIKEYSGQINLRVIERSDGGSGGYGLVGDFQINSKSLSIKGKVKEKVISNWLPIQLGDSRAYPHGFDVVYDQTIHHEDGQVITTKALEEIQALRGEITDEHTGSGWIRLGGGQRYIWELAD